MGGGNKKGGGGSVQAPQVQIPSQMQGELKNLESVASYEAGAMNAPYDIGNYYMSLATGGQPGLQAVPQDRAGLAGQGMWTSYLPGGSVNTYGPGGTLGGGGTTGGTGGGGGAVTSGAGPQGQQQVTGGEPMLQSGPGGTQGIYINNPNLNFPDFVPVSPGQDPKTVLNKYLSDYKGSTYSGPFQGGTTTTGAPTSAAPAAAAAPAGAGTQVGGTTFPATSNPWLSEFQQMLGAEYGTASQIPGIQQATAALGQNITGETNYLGQLAPAQMDQANQMLTGAQADYAQAQQGYQTALGGYDTAQAGYQAAQAPYQAAQAGYAGSQAELAARNQGQLLPGQQAMIDAQVGSSQAQLKQQLAGMGLGSSTMGTELGGEIGLQGAAVGGQLMQGNIQLAQTDVQNAIAQETAMQQGISLSQAQEQIAQQHIQGAMGQEAVALQGMSLAQAEQQIAQGDFSLLQSAQKLGLGAQTLQLGEEQALYQQFQNIGTQSMDAQSTLFQQAMQGYGLAGQFLNQTLAPIGMTMQGFSSILGANEAAAQNQTSLEIAQLQAQQQQAQGLGSLFQGLGSLFGMGGGGAGAAAGGGLLDTFLGGGAISAGDAATALGGIGAAAGGSSILGSLGGLVGLVAAF